MIVNIEPVLSPISTGWQGIARLAYGRRGDTCVLLDSFTQAPIKVQKSLYPEGQGVCHTVLVHTAGGLVGGDSLAIQVALEADCRVLVTTAAANKAYGTASEKVEPPRPLATQKIHLTVAPGGCLEWFPQETIVFNGAQYRQDLRVELGAGAAWAGWDITRFGRSARGERFTQGHWRSHLEVWQNNRPLWLDRQYLVGGSPVLHSPHGLAGHPVVGSFALVGLTPEPHQINALRQLWPPDQPGDVGVTRLQTGLLCRYRGPSSQAARQWFVAAWQALRPWYLGQTASVPRVWPR